MTRELKVGDYVVHTSWTYGSPNTVVCKLLKLDGINAFIQGIGSKRLARGEYPVNELRLAKIEEMI